MAASMVPVSAVGGRAAAAVRSRLRGWLVDPESAARDDLPIALHPPSERIVARDPDAARDWTRAWLAYAGPGTVETTTVRWPSFGVQEIPVRLELAGADEIARAAGEQRRWRTLVDRRDRLVACTPDSEGYRETVAGLHRQWADLADDDFARLVATLAWLLAHPDSQLLIRQLPIVGVDTKWLGRHRTLVERLVEGVRGSRDLGVRTAPRLVEVIVRDRSLLPGLPRVFAAPIDELAALPITPHEVLVVENRECLHALDDRPGAIAVHGGGNAAVALAAIGWLVAAPDVVYWGDLDAAGVTIVGRLRRLIPHLRTVMTDVATLRRWQDLAVPGKTVVDTTDLPLTPEERDLLEVVLDEELLLEQERIPWEWAAERLG